MKAKDNSIHEDEVDLYDCWKTILKRKKFIIGLCFIVTSLVAVISFLMPKIYKGEVVLEIAPKEVVTAKEAIKAKEIIDVMGEIDRERISVIFAKKPSSVVSIKMEEIRGFNDKMKVIIETKSVEDIHDSFVVFVEYMNNSPLIKRFVEKERAILMRKLHELSVLTQQSETLAKSFLQLFKEGKLIPVGFDPVELNRKVFELRIEKSELEQALENFIGVEMIGQPFVSKKPVKPHIKLYIAIAGLLSIFTGIILAFFIEYIENIRYQNKKNTD